MNPLTTIIVMYALAFVVGLVYRMVLRKIAKGGVRAVGQNIGNRDRWLRLATGLGLLVVAALTNWSPILVFASGFCVFEAVFSWCGLYAAIGKSTCPLE